MTKPIVKNKWILRDAKTNEPIMQGSTVKDFRGDELFVDGGAPPHKEGSTGRVYTSRGSFFPTVIGAKWVKI
jgi:hypothetical protein